MSSDPPRLFTLLTVPLAAKYVSVLAPPIGKAVIYGFLVTQKLEFLVMNILAKFHPELAASKTHGTQSWSFFHIRILGISEGTPSNAST